MRIADVPVLPQMQPTISRDLPSERCFLGQHKETADLPQLYDNETVTITSMIPELVNFGSDVNGVVDKRCYLVFRPPSHDGQ